MCMSRSTVSIGAGRARLSSSRTWTGSDSTGLAARPRRGRRRAGEWLVVHSGYAIERVTADEADAVIADLRAAGGSDGAWPVDEAVR